MERDNVGLTWEDGFVLQLGEGEAPRFVDEAGNTEREPVGINVGDPSVVADEVVLVVGDFRLDEAPLNQPRLRSVCLSQ